MREQKSVVARGSIPLPASINAILFDLDGTLYLQPRVRRWMLVRLARNVCLHPVQGTRAARLLRAYRSSQEELRSGEICDGKPTQLMLACAKVGMDKKEAEQIVRKWMEALPLDLIAKSVRPGLISFLQAAAARGIRCAVVSDYPAEEKLAAMGIREYFSTVISPAAEAVRFKPAPDGIRAALRLLGASASNAIYVGDRHDVDAEAASRAGIAAVLIAPGRPFGCHVPVVRNFSELRILLQL